jgi:hypothetical protein
MLNGEYPKYKKDEAVRCFRCGRKLNLACLWISNDNAAGRGRYQSNKCFECNSSTWYDIVKEK